MSTSMTGRFLAVAAAVTLSTIMAPQLRAQDFVLPRKKPDTLTVQVFRGGLHNPAPIPKDAILRVDTVKAVPRRDGTTCDFGCSIIYWTVDSAKVMEATKRDKR
jgi:hypothetical protein